MIGHNQITSFFSAGFCTVGFLRAGTPSLYFLKPHDVSRLRAGICREGVALFS